MGAPNKGPFEYVLGSLQLYIELLNYKMNFSRPIITKTFNTKKEVLDNINMFNESMKPQIKSFLKKAGSQYISFEYCVYENGLHKIKATNPGIVPNSFAEYNKIMYKDGTIRAVYKDTTDNHGRKVHRHIKYPIEEI